MYGYKTHVVISDPNYTVLRDLPFQIGQRVEVVLFEESEQVVINDSSINIHEQEWLHGAARNPVFDFLADADEDIYNMNDGVEIQ